MSMSIAKAREIAAECEANRVAGIEYPDQEKQRIAAALIRLSIALDSHARVLDRVVKIKKLVDDIAPRPENIDGMREAGW